ncbi:MAG: hypothetical protein AB7V56_09090 [Candidatus Nitrosocosmicus sp.]
MSSNGNIYKFSIFELEEIESERVRTNVEQVGIKDFVKKYIVKRKDLGEDVIESEIIGFVTNMQKIISKINSQHDKFDIDSIDINTQISAEGKIGFMGTGIALTGTAGITFTFKKK